MTVLALEKMDADGLAECLYKAGVLPSDIDEMEIQDGRSKPIIHGYECNTVAFHLIPGIVEKEKINKILIEKEIVFVWL